MRIVFLSALIVLLVPEILNSSSAGGQKDPPPETRETHKQELEQPDPAGGPSPVKRATSRPGLALDATNISLTTLIKRIMQELGYPCLIDPDVQGIVSVYTHGEIAHGELFPLLERMLQMNGQAIIQVDGMYVITPLQRATKIPYRLIVKSAGTPGSRSAPKDERQP